MADSSQQRELLLRQACAELCTMLRSGEEVRAETIFSRHPDLAADPEAALEVLYTEWVTREELGQAPSEEDLYNRFPQWRDRLRRLLEVHAGMIADVTETQTDDSDLDHKSNPIYPEISSWRLGAYEVLEQIGRGGMGVVFRGRHRVLGRQVALKRLLGGPYAEPEQLARFRTEAEAAACLDHPNIVKIFEINEENSQPYLVLELVSGGSLADLLLKSPLSPFRTAELMETLARAVQHAHERGILHRDLKP